MPDRSVERNLTGETVEERDRVQLEAALTGLEDLRRELHGLPAEQVVVEGESIPPVTLTSLESAVDPLHQSHTGITSIPGAHDSHFAKKIHEDRLRKKAEKKAA